MRVRLRIGGSETALGPSLPLMGRVLHPDSNRAEWAIVALDTPLSVVGVDIELLCLRPAVAGAQVGDQVDVTVHVAPVVGVGKVEGQPSYKLGELLGQIVCCGVAEAEPGDGADGGRI